MSRVTFEAFRPELVADAVRQPELDQLVGRARLRRRRRRGLAALAVAVLVLAGALSVLVPPRRGAEPVGPAIRHSGSRDVVFVDPDTIVEVVFDPCHVLFSVSGDGGRRWTPYRGPVPESTCPWSGPGHPVSYQVLDAHVFLTTIDAQQYLTTDTGLSWRRVPAQPVPVDEFDPRTTLLCQSSCTGRSAVQAVDLVGGTVQELRATSGLPTLAAVRGTADGAIWLTGWDMHGGPTVAWSVDHGRTWGTKALPHEVVEQMVLAACTARTAYLLLGFDPEVTVFATADGGLTWDQHAPGVPSSGDPAGAFCTTDGALAMATAKDLWVSFDRGATFARSASTPAGDAGCDRNLLWIRDPDAVHGYLTVDGRTWRQVDLSPE